MPGPAGPVYFSLPNRLLAMETRNFLLSLFLVSAALASLGFIPVSESRQQAPAAPALAVATFAGGCFWPQEEIFEEVRGVTAVVAGYAGGATAQPRYADVAAGRTGHAETVQVTYNPRQISYQQLLDVFFLGAHNPTELNRQGPDRGTAVRSIAFYRTPAEQQLIAATIRRVNAAHRYPGPVVTQVQPYRRFWPAEAYHQGYYRAHPDNGYVSRVSRPRVEAFRREFPQLLKPVEGR